MFVISLAVGAFILLFAGFLFGYIVSVACGSVCCGCNVDQSTDCFGGKKFIAFIHFLKLSSKSEYMQ